MGDRWSEYKHRNTDNRVVFTKQRASLYADGLVTIEHIEMQWVR